MEAAASAPADPAAPVARRYAVPCVPPRWARGGNAQTLFGHILPSAGSSIARNADARRREVELPGGDRLVVYALPPAGVPSGVRVHLFHGLSGDVDSDYMRRTAGVLRAGGHEVWAVNHRGCGDGRGLASEPYHSGRTDDLQAVLAESRDEAPDAVHVVIGFSLSGNLALLGAAQHLEPAPHGIVAVNPPVDLRRATEDMQRGLSRLYQLRFIWRLRRAIRERERDGRLDGHYDIPLRSTMLQFDDAFTAPVCGFDDGLDYYRRCSAGPRLGEVRTPSVILSAADDPFVSPATFEDLPRSRWLQLHLEPVGGHVGYVERRGRSWGCWLDGALEHYTGELGARAR